MGMKKTNTVIENKAFLFVTNSILASSHKISSCARMESLMLKGYALN
jgi:hypothetical protein